MNPFANEEIMWQRLKDLQREAENSRLLAQSTLPGLVHLVRWFGHAAWSAMHAAGLAPRWWAASDRTIPAEDPEADTNAA